MWTTHRDDQQHSSNSDASRVCRQHSLRWA